jgi:hypothetical protein
MLLGASIRSGFQTFCFLKHELKICLISPSRRSTHVIECNYIEFRLMQDVSLFYCIFHTIPEIRIKSIKSANLSPNIAHGTYAFLKSSYSSVKSPWRVDDGSFFKASFRSRASSHFKYNPVEHDAVSSLPPFLPEETNHIENEQFKCHTKRENNFRPCFPSEG